MDQALNRGSEKKALVKGKCSNLATALLSLWSHGKLAATTCRWLAEQAILDGATHPELHDLAKAGCHGQYPANIQRDICARFIKDVFVPEPTMVTTRCINTKSLKKEEEEAGVFLPHLMFASLGTLPNFSQQFPVEHLETFWTTLEKSGDPALKNHPMIVKNWKKFTIPIFVHGDGVQYSQGNSLMVWSWGALMASFSSLQSKYLICCWPKNATSDKTWPDLLKEITWSFASLANGYHPTHDSSGSPLKKGSPFFEMRGKPLRNGYQAVIWAIQGDAEWQANSLGLPHWCSTRPCAECDCTSDPCNKGKYFKNIEIDTQEFVKVTHEQALANPCSSNLLFHAIPGVSTKFCRGDALHIMFVGGIHAHLLGSVCHYLCYFDGHGRQKKSAQERLEVLWGNLQDAYRTLESKTRLTNLRLNMFTDPKHPHSAYPTLSIKGSESKHLLPALLLVCQSMLDPCIFHERCMLDCMEHLQKVVGIFDEQDIVLTIEKWTEAFTLAKGFLDTYSLLNHWGEEEERLLFHKVYKFHSFQHLVENSRYLNPKGTWCFSNEDFVGKISCLTFSISPGVAAKRLSAKVAPKYRILLHLLLTREKFEDTLQEFSFDL